MLTDPNHYLRVLFLLHPNFRVFPRYSVLRPLTPETTKTLKFQSFESFFVFYFIFYLANHIATYITFYVHQNNTSLKVQYLHQLRSALTTIRVGKNYKTHNTQLTEGKILSHQSKVAYLLPHAVRTLNICSHYSSVEDSPFSREQGCPGGYWTLFSLFFNSRLDSHKTRGKIFL